MRRNVFLKLLPLLALYFAVFFVFARDSINYGDESRYAQYAEARYLCPPVPFIFMIVTYTATNFIKVQLCEKKR